MGACASKSAMLKNVDDDDTVPAPLPPLGTEEVEAKRTEELKRPVDVNAELEDRAEAGLEEAHEAVEATKDEPQSSEVEACEGIQAKLQQSSNDETKDTPIEIMENETSESGVYAIEDAKSVETIETSEAETSVKAEAEEVEASVEKAVAETTEAETSSDKIEKEVEASDDNNAVETTEAETSSDKIEKEVEASDEKVEEKVVETTEAENKLEVEASEAEIVEEKKVEEEKPAVAISRFRLWF